MALGDFSNFLMRKIGEKYRPGIEGLRDRFMTVFNQLSRINVIALSMHKKALEHANSKVSTGTKSLSGNSHAN